MRVKFRHSPFQTPLDETIISCKTLSPGSIILIFFTLGQPEFSRQITSCYEQLSRRSLEFLRILPFRRHGLRSYPYQINPKGLEKSVVHVPHRKALLMPLTLLQFHAHLIILDSAYCACFSRQFFAFFTGANLAPCTLDNFFPHHALSRDSVTFTSSGASCIKHNVSLTSNVRHSLHSKSS